MPQILLAISEPVHTKCSERIPGHCPGILSEHLDCQALSETEPTPYIYAYIKHRLRIAASICLPVTCATRLASKMRHHEMPQPTYHVISTPGVRSMTVPTHVIRTCCTKCHNAPHAPAPCAHNTPHDMTACVAACATEPGRTALISPPRRVKRLPVRSPRDGSSSSRCSGAPTWHRGGWIRRVPPLRSPEDPCAAAARHGDPRQLVKDLQGGNKRIEECQDRGVRGRRAEGKGRTEV